VRARARRVYRAARRQRVHTPFCYSVRECTRPTSTSFPFRQRTINGSLFVVRCLACCTIALIKKLLLSTIRRTKKRTRFEFVLQSLGARKFICSSKSPNVSGETIRRLLFVINVCRVVYRGQLKPKHFFTHTVTGYTKIHIRIKTYLRTSECHTYVIPTLFFNSNDRVFDKIVICNQDTRCPTIRFNTRIIDTKCKI